MPMVLYDISIYKEMFNKPVFMTVRCLNVIWTAGMITNNYTIIESPENVLLLGI